MKWLVRRAKGGMDEYGMPVVDYAFLDSHESREQAQAQADALNDPEAPARYEVVPEDDRYRETPP